MKRIKTIFEKFLSRYKNRRQSCRYRQLKAEAAYKIKIADVSIIGRNAVALIVDGVIVSFVEDKDPYAISIDGVSSCGSMKPTLSLKKAKECMEDIRRVYVEGKM